MKQNVLVLLRSNYRLLQFEYDNSSSNTLALFTIYKHEYKLHFWDLNIGHLYYVYVCISPKERMQLQ